jgi:hypothetical protein
MGILMLVSSLLLARAALATRTGEEGQYYTPISGIIMLFSGLSLFGFGLVLVTRSPLRMGFWERLFRIVWLGAPGRAFLRSVAKGTESARSVTGVAHHPVRAGAAPSVKMTLAAPTAMTPVIATPAGEARLDALESRIAHLERKLDVR